MALAVALTLAVGAAAVEDGAFWVCTVNLCPTRMVLFLRLFQDCKLATDTLYLCAIPLKVSPDLTSWVILLEPAGTAEALEEALLDEVLLDEALDEVFDEALVAAELPE